MRLTREVLADLIGLEEHHPMPHKRMRGGPAVVPVSPYRRCEARELAPIMPTFGTLEWWGDAIDPRPYRRRACGSLLR